LTKKRKKAVRLTKGFIGRVSDEIKNIKLPPYPWSLRFDKALFDRMKNEFPGERTRLRVALKRYCRALPAQGLPASPGIGKYATQS